MFNEYVLYPSFDYSNLVTAKHFYLMNQTNLELSGQLQRVKTRIKVLQDLKNPREATKQDMLELAQLIELRQYLIDELHKVGHKHSH